MPAAEPATAEFLDANVLVYAFTASDPRTAVAEALLMRGCCIGVQGLNEFSSVAQRKLKTTWPEVEKALAAIRSVCPKIIPLDIGIHESGIALAARYRLSVYDGLMIAAARRAGCRVFWSEDMQDGLVIESHLAVRNPFLRA